MDFKNELWKNYGTDRDPKLTSYIYGLPLYFDYLRIKNKNDYYDMIYYFIDHNIYERKFVKNSNKYDKYLFLKKDIINLNLVKYTVKNLN